MDWKEVQNLYPVNQEMIWLNNCGTTPASTRVIEIVNKFLHGYSKKGVYTDVEGYVFVKRYIHECMSEIISANPDEIAIIHNTSEGMNFISHGLNLKSGEEILVLENEYPSNVYPWEHWKTKGVSLKFIPVGKSPQEFFDIFQKVVSSQTKVVSLSAAHWCTGMPLPLEQVGEFCESHGIYFVVDGAQGVGNFFIDVKKFKIHFMAFSGWKWLLGPLGIGILYIDKQKLEEIQPIFKGSDSVSNPEEYLPYKTEFKKNVDRFEFSTSSFLNWVYFKASLSLLREIGWNTVQARIHELASFTTKQLREIGFELESDYFSEPTGIIVGKHQKFPTSQIVSHLRSHKILVTERLGQVRFSAHIYNSEEQILHVREVLEKIL